MKTSFVFLALVAFVCAHNWLNTPSRSPGASTVKPCRPRLSTTPHVQVIARQEFYLEWMTGHDGRSFTYFTVVHAKNVSMLAQLNRQDLEAYFLGCPDCPAPDDANPSTLFTDDLYRKQHVKAVNRPPSAEEAGYYDNAANNLDPSVHPYAIVRPARFDGLGIRAGTNTTTYIYKPKYEYRDLYAEYFNPAYPYIEAMWRYQNFYHRPSEFDIARIWVPALNGVGEYVVHYYWGGYQDCTDVEVVELPNPTPAPYGIRGTGSSYSKIDHCQFRSPEDIRTGCMEVVQSPEQCMAQCSSTNEANCYGINVVPFHLPDLVYHQTKRAVKVPWENQRCAGAYDEFANANVGEDALVCYGFRPGVATSDINGVYTISDDPEDALFYSTCYLRVPNFDFSANGVEKVEVVPPPAPWNWGDKCISCRDYAFNQLKGVTPRWRLIDQCIDCLENPYPGDVEAELASKWEQISLNDRTCDGHWGWSTASLGAACQAQGVECTKTMKLLGTSDVYPEECRLLAAADPECSNTVMFHSRNKDCLCYKNDACCGTCTPKRQTGWAVYKFETESFKFPTSVNPVDCVASDGTVGIMTDASAPTQGCCEPSCAGLGGAAACGLSACNTISGSCCLESNGVPIARLCNETGFPCVF